jgi:hypothetical protein
MIQLSDEFYQYSTDVKEMLFSQKLTKHMQDIYYLIFPVAFLTLSTRLIHKFLMERSWDVLI